MSQSAGDQTAAFRRACLVAGITVIGIGALVLIGWAFNIEILKRVVPGFAAMNPVSAVLLVLAGTALLLVRLKANLTAPRKIAARLAATIVTAIGATKSFSLISGWDSGVDQWLFTSALMDSQTGIQIGWRQIRRLILCSSVARCF